MRKQSGSGHVSPAAWWVERPWRSEAAFSHCAQHRFVELPGQENDFGSELAAIDVMGRTLSDTGSKIGHMVIARSAALMQLNDRFRDVEDPADLAYAAAEMLGRTLDVSRAGYGTIDTQAETITIERDWNAPGISSLAGILHFRDYGSYIEDLKRGETVVFADAEKDPRTAATADALKAISAQSVVNMPVTEQGGLVALLYLNHETAREWTEEELEFIKDVAERTRAVVERRRVEEELRNSERRFRAVFENAGVGMLEIDSDWQILGANRAYADLVGSTREELIGQSCLAFTHPDDVPRSEIALREAASARPGERVGFEKRYALPDGTIWVRSNLAKVSAAGEAARFLKVIEDITAEKLALKALSSANASLEQRVAEALAERKVLAEIVESTDAFVQVADTGFNLLAINRASADEFERIFGTRPRVGDNMLDLLRDRPGHKAAVEKVWARALKGEKFTEIGEFGDPDLDRRFYEMKYNSLRDDAGNVVAAYQFVYDVTDRLRDQARLAEAEEALRQSQKMEAVGQLVSGLAHDFNNVLGAVLAALDLIRRRGDDPDRVRRFAEAGMQAAERGAKLTAQLLTFSRTQRVQLVPLHVGDVITSIHELIDRTTGPLVEVDFRLDPSPVAVLADATQVEMMLLNLVINARDAMPEGGKLVISTLRRTVEEDPELAPGEYVELKVRDTGIGMDEQTVQRALEPFFTTKPVGKGTGLGLAQVYGSARQAGGTVRIQSRLDAGTTVSVLFPCSDGAALPSVGEPKPANPQSRDKASVLLIDDDDDLRGVLSSALEALGYEVTSASDGAVGLAFLRKRPPDVLVVDFAMPGLNGAEVARQAREICPGLPVVIASGFSDTDAIERAIGKDARLLQKPFRLDELLEAVGQAASAQEKRLARDDRAR